MLAAAVAVLLLVPTDSADEGRDALKRRPAAAEPGVLNESAQPLPLYVVATLSTVPARVAKLRAVLESVLAQEPQGILAKVELNLPRFCTRTNETYPAIPDWLKSYYPRVVIVEADDLGPITKVAPALLRHAGDQAVWLWSVDDDMIYGAGVLAGLLEFRGSASALLEGRATTAGVPALQRATSVDGSELSLALRRLAVYGGDDAAVLVYDGLACCAEGSTEFDCPALSFPQVFQGYRSVLYPPRLLLGVERIFASYIALATSNADCRVSDDVVMSNFLEARGLPRVKTGEEFRGTIEVYSMDKDATQAQSGGHAQRYPRVVAFLRAQGILFLDGREPCA